jgi:hypothetical protein
MSKLPNFRSGVRRLLAALLGVVAVANAKAPELAARDSHRLTLDSPPSAAAEAHHHAPASDSDTPAWIASPFPCDHCANGAGCDERPGCTPGSAALLSALPTIGFVGIERVRAGRRPDRPLAENPTPPTPPPPSIL